MIVFYDKAIVFITQICIVLTAAHFAEILKRPDSKPVFANEDCFACLLLQDLNKFTSALYICMH